MVKLRLKEQATGVVDLYDKIAEQLGFDSDKCNYDCTKIEVNNSIGQQIEDSYENKEIFAMHWLCFGPKVNSDLEPGLVAIKDGFLKFLP